MRSTQRPYDAVFFDFDGTLADSYGAITASVNHVRACHGLPPVGEPEVRRSVGRGMLYLLERTVPGFDPDADPTRYREHHPSVLRSGTRLLPGAAEAVAALHAAGVRLAVTSNKPKAFTHELLDVLGLASSFAAVLGPEDVPRIKPAPDMLLRGLERLGVSPREALYVGDMVVDIETARGAGVTVWVVPTGSNDRATLEAARPDRVLEDLHELAGLARAWAG
jgi:2-phosphoglycolate phosphatase